MKVLRVDETWADCEVLSGTMRGMGRGAVWGPGDTKTVRIEHGVWTLVPNDPSSATRHTGRHDCNRDAHAGFAAAHG